MLSAATNVGLQQLLDWGSGAARGRCRHDGNVELRKLRDQRLDQRRVGRAQTGGAADCDLAMHAQRACALADQVLVRPSLA